jgi:hypothetical protein
MKLLPVRVDPFPSLYSGPRTIKCECGYEVVFVIPEEVDYMFSSVLQHIQQHGVEIPTILVEMH